MPPRGGGLLPILTLEQIKRLEGYRPRVGCGLHLVPVASQEHVFDVTVPAKGAGCIIRFQNGCGGQRYVAVPVRGAGCVQRYKGLLSVADGVTVPVWGVDCVRKGQRTLFCGRVAVPAWGVAYILGNTRLRTVPGSYRPREGCGLRQEFVKYLISRENVTVPAWGVDCVGTQFDEPLIREWKGYRPREGYGLRLM